MTTVSIQNSHFTIKLYTSINEESDIIGAIMTIGNTNHMIDAFSVLPMNVSLNLKQHAFLWEACSYH